MALDSVDLALALKATEPSRSAVTGPPTKAPFVGADVTGMPRDLATAETNAIRRLSPRRNRWPELAELDARVAELEQRRGDTGTRLGQLREQLANAPREDADRLAEWEVGNRKGPRPEPTTIVLERQITEAEAEVAGLETAVSRVLAEKAAFVEKHRARLVRDADKATAEAHERVVQLLGELEQARDALVELRQSAVWAAVYPAESAGRGPRPTLLAGGLRKPIAQTLGINQQMNAAQLVDALRADADYWRNAATAEQRAAMGDTPPPRLGAGVWVGTPEADEAERAERKAARERYAAVWGSEPPEWS